ncbi:hypothetical protein L2E82_51330 [Cichorium intybus]|nr:hypothetical protein L2E82_51330 [Cichorium intybus]
MPTTLLSKPSTTAKRQHTTIGPAITHKHHQTTIAIAVYKSLPQHRTTRLGFFETPLCLFLYDPANISLYLESSSSNRTRDGGPPVFGLLYRFHKEKSASLEIV